jgi:hypothetical protein
MNKGIVLFAIAGLVLGGCSSPAESKVTPGRAWPVQDLPNDPSCMEFNTAGQLYGHWVWTCERRKV